MNVRLIAASLWLGVLVLSPAVQAEQVCGNGVVEAPEICDDGNTVEDSVCDADCGAPPSLALSAATAAEGTGAAGSLQLLVTRTGNATNPIDFSAATTDQGAAPATAGVDYTALLASVRFTLPGGATTTTVTVPLLPDAVAEHDESLLVRLSDAYRAGTIQLAGPQAVAMGDGAVYVAVVDLNGDGKPDLVTMDSAGTATVRLNATTGGTLGFTDPVPHAIGSLAIGSVAAGDLDGDGMPEVATVNRDGSNDAVLVFRNTQTPGTVLAGAAVFADVEAFPVGVPVNAVAIGDMDGDGKADLVTANGTDGISTLRNQSTSGTLAFADAEQVATGLDHSAITLADLDGDGRRDVLLGGAGGMTLVRNTSTSGDIAFGVVWTPLAGVFMGVAAVDLDGDGKRDYIAADEGNKRVTTMHNRSSPGGFGAADTKHFAVSDGPYDLAVGDLDGDGKPDIVTANRLSDTASVLRNASVPTSIAFAAKQSFAVGGQPHSVAIGDLDGDGQADFAGASLLDDAATLWMGDRPGVAIATAEAVGTITNDDEPVVHFTSATTSVDETAGSVTLTVSVTGVHDTIEVGYTLGGTATEGADYTIAPPTLTFAPDEYAKTLTIGDLADAADEDAPTETLTVTLQDPAGAALGTDVHTVTITNDSLTPALVAFAATAVAVNESAGTTTLNVNLSRTMAETVDVAYVLGGTAEQGADYAINPAILSFAPGETAKALTISGLADAASEGSATETLVVTLVDPANADLGASAAATVTITNDSLPDPAAGGGGAMGFGLLMFAVLRRYQRRDAKPSK